MKRSLRRYWLVLVFFLMAAPVFSAEYLGDVKIEKTSRYMDEPLKIVIFQAEASRFSLRSALDRSVAGAKEFEIKIKGEKGLLQRIASLKEGGSTLLDDEELYLVKESLSFAELSEGALDPTDQPLGDLWAAAKSSATIPTDAQIQAAKSQVGYKNLSLDLASKTLTIKKEGIRLDLDDIMKAYAVDQIVSFLKNEGVRSGIVSIGSVARSIGTAPNGRFWKYGIEHPRKVDEYAAVLEIEEALAVATSGDYDNFFLYQGRRYSDHLDSKTGFPAQTLTSGMTVIAKNAVWAEMLSKVFFILGPEKAYGLCEKLVSENVRAFAFESKDGENFTLSGSEGIQNYLKDIEL